LLTDRRCARTHATRRRAVVLSRRRAVAPSRSSLSRRRPLSRHRAARVSFHPSAVADHIFAVLGGKFLADIYKHAAMLSSASSAVCDVQRDPFRCVRP